MPPSNSRVGDPRYSKLVHEQIVPADVRQEDKVLARIRTRSEEKGNYVKVQVWRISPLGLEVRLPSESNSFSKGTPVEVELTIHGQRTYYSGIVADILEDAKLGDLTGIRITNEHNRSSRKEERRSRQRWICSEEFYPICVAPSPTRINDFMRFIVRDISANGLQLVCSLRNKFLLPGTILRLNANFPFVGDWVAPVRVVRVGFTSFQGKDRLSVGVELVKQEEHVNRTMAQYLTQFGSATSLEELRNSGLIPTSIKSHVEHKWLKEEEDYKKVLQLRFDAHKKAGNFVNESTCVDDMGDFNDTRARIAIGVYNNQVVSTGRIRYNDVDEPLEHESFVDWPDTLPRRDQIIEVSRVCTHHDFRNSDLFVGLLQFISGALVQTERPYVLIGSWPSMVKFYEKTGMRTTELRHGEPLWRDEQILMIGNMRDMLLGRGVNPFYWCTLWAEAADHHIASGLIEVHGIDRIRLFFLRCLRPIASLVSRTQRKPRKTRS